MKDYDLFENTTNSISYKSYKLILVIVFNYICQKINVIIHYNQLLTPKLGCGSDIYSVIPWNNRQRKKSTTKNRVENK